MSHPSGNRCTTPFLHYMRVASGQTESEAQLKQRILISLTKEPFDSNAQQGECAPMH